MTARIVEVDAWQVLDSRGRPTVAARVVLADGTTAEAAVPSGASTGTHEAVELRDRATAWAGLGVGEAVENVRGPLATAVRNMDARDQASIDAVMEDLDGTPLLARIGANAILSVSLAAALAAARHEGLELWERLGRDRGRLPNELPMPMVNVLSGGAHAAGFIDIQDVLVVPIGATSFSQAIEWSARVRNASADVLHERGLDAALVADEGGIAGRLPSNRDALALVVEGMKRACLEPGVDVAIALDVAATQFLTGDGLYQLKSESRVLSSGQLTNEVASWCEEFPVVSVEDLLAEDDWEGWHEATRRLLNVQLVGDDLFVTNAERLQRGIDESVASSVLVKVNQAGTVTRASRVMEKARSAAYSTVVSARSGETEDTWLADLAMGWDAGQIKVGSTTRSERTAKWNRLLRIEHDLHGAAGLARFPRR